MDQVNDREAQMEMGLIGTPDEFEFDFFRPLQLPRPTLQSRPIALSDASTSAGHPTPYIYGDALLALTDRLNSTGSYAEAAGLLHQLLEPSHGLLERLGEFFEAAGEKAKEAGKDSGFDLSDDLADAAAEMRDLGERLHLAEDQMRALATPPHPRWPAASPNRLPQLPALPPSPPRPLR